MGGAAPMQYSNSGGMGVALVALLVIVLLCRWVFSTGHRERRTATRSVRTQSRGDYGLLVPVATVRSEEDAAVLRSVLRDGGIRGTVASGAQPGERVVLVFRDDEDRARSLVAR